MSPIAQGLDRAAAPDAATAKRMLDSINLGAIYRFYTKPWDDTQLRDNIRLAFHHYWLMHGSGRRVGQPEEDATALLPSHRSTVNASIISRPSGSARAAS